MALKSLKVLNRKRSRSTTTGGSRLTFSHSDVLNTDISDEEGCKLYNISTPMGWHERTTITEYPKDGGGSEPTVLGVIEWHMIHDAVIQFRGKTVEVGILLQERRRSS